ncbi:hypothetical protein GOPIP_092_00200 [Gordonia polyisoprenivorans NBRC 16320 = JCM 10675]|uniref:PE domain-containing protein n=2 Tax=Gordonia TaxID=2053 RepID=A0A3N4GHF6_9ACTN|nr:MULTISPECIES: hypothetical protein [Gordonia]NKY04071.1 hypothetical protein [Gordonia polyisoprenivorans]RPA58060.1 hypothetical protein EF294_16810 [Gordonia oryzae]GAB26102.1 hypothetical protein GOPIP_092_00200 [Gordonia polyisoprenivorans NBRC 16320 = JCM 10675]
MADLGVTPAALRAAAAHLAATSSNLGEVLSSLESSLAGEGAPWGDDEPGTQFATGGAGGGYLGQKQSVSEAISAKVDLLTTYSEGLRNTADNLEGGDTAGT